MPKESTSEYYKNNPKARAVRLAQQKRYDNGPKRSKILKYHRQLSRFRNKYKKNRANAERRNGGKPVDIIHKKGKIVGYGDRSRNRAEPRTRKV